MSNHTAGPWNVGWSHWPDDEEIAYGINRGKGTVTDSEAIANCALIAAAPDLYEACQAAFVLLSEYAPIWAVKVEDQLREALAKARG